jgi:hypothetical protein
MKNICACACVIFFALGGAVAQTTVTTTGGTTNSIPKFSGAATVVNSVVTEVNGKVGINNTTPQRTFDVQGDASNGYGVSNFHSSVLMGMDNTQGATLFVNGPIIAQFQESLLYGTGACCNTGGLGNTGGSSLGSTAGFSSSYNGAYFNANGTADGDGNVGHQINTSVPSWRMALGSGTAEWPGGDNFVVARVPAGGNYLAPSILFRVNSSGFAKVAGGVTFPDGSTQTTAITTYHAFCAGGFGSSDSVVLNPLGQNSFPNCFLLYNGFGVRYVPEFGNGSQAGDFPIYIDSPNNTTVDTQYGFAVPRAGTLANLRVSAITQGSSSISGIVLVRKIHTNNTVDNNSSDILLTCTVGTGTSCSDTTHTLSISAGERILVTVKTGSSETLASISVLVDLQ